MESKKVFPHRLSLENNIKCDICWCDSNSNFINVISLWGFVIVLINVRNFLFLL